MLKEINITAEYFRKYRLQLGFSNQDGVKNFFGGKDIIPVVDFEHVKLLNQRLYGIIDKINSVVSQEIKIEYLTSFKKENIDHSFEIIKNSNIFPILNNQGRRPEQVYFSWMRGFVLSRYFLKALGLIFEVDLKNISLIGDDDLKNINTFKRTAKSDLEIVLNSKEKLRIEIQTGFAGINDIKQHKVLEAKKVFQEFGLSTIAIHFDLYNGQVAFIKLDKVEDNGAHWITRQQMEGQTVFNIDQNNFIWKITDDVVKYREINFN